MKQLSTPDTDYIIRVTKDFERKNKKLKQIKVHPEMYGRILIELGKNETEEVVTINEVEIVADENVAEGHTTQVY